MSVWKDFKTFAFRGNVLDLAVAVIIAAAFTKIVSAVVDAVIMPLVGKILPGGSYEAWAPGGVHVGIVIAAVLDFLIVAAVLFLVVSAMKRMSAKRGEAAPASAPSPEVVLLTEIRDQLAHQPGISSRVSTRGEA
jgi:large conductance mechanosensitive channel